MLRGDDTNAFVESKENGQEQDGAHQRVCMKTELERPDRVKCIQGSVDI